MKLADYMTKNDLSFSKIERATGIPKTTVFRIAKDAGYCIKLLHAKILVDFTKGEVDFTDLLNGGDC